MMDAIQMIFFHVYYQGIMLLAIGRELGLTDLFTEIVGIEEMELRGGDEEEIKARLSALSIWECDTND